ncbi:tetratricopeptide repeat protein [Flavobacterium piscis]|uniref:Tetratricopeptide (TPR) repeat protein n=1 Tax=Flavobacterium piscis TaxID=1114874 RepID=A0ABU1YB37_9FLAO|nr:tetratricopeptide repeat protein [Flavobacterium piscis]MDR7211457.1 tetratricopeptide (TPR) repeat protein [Flavobacterium piscis]
MMKCTIKYILILLLIPLQFVAQESYQNVKKNVEKSLQTYTKNGKINTYLNTIISNFNESKKNELKDLKKDNVGICIVLSEDNPDLIISPAKYTFDDEKINISGIGPQNPSKLPDYMEEYVQKYLTEFESIGSTILFQKLILKRIATEGTLTENKTESIVNEPNTVSFIRGNDDWMYIISIDDDYKNLANPRIMVYCFKKSISGKDIFNLNNSLEDAEKRRENKQAKHEEDREKYPLYHDFRIDDLRIGLKQLIKYEPYKSNQELLNHANKLNEKLDRFSIRNYVKELNYLVDLKISEAFLKEHFDDPPHGEYEVENITHLSAHSLGDIYFSQGNYQLAKEFYTKAIFTNPLIELSGTTVGKDVDRTIYDLAKNAYKAGKKDEAYAFLIALMLDSNIDTKEDINIYFKEENEDKKQFKKDLDKALKTLKKGEKYSYTFTFKGNEVFFIPILQATVKSFQEVFKSQEFYKSLE